MAVNGKTIRRRYEQSIFSGIDRSAAAGDGAFFTLYNFGPESYPALSTLKNRRIYRIGKDSESQICGVFSFRGHFIYILSGEDAGIYIDGVKTDSPEITGNDIRSFTAVGDYLMIFPDRYFIKFPRAGYENDLVITDEEISYVKITPDDKPLFTLRLGDDIAESFTRLQKGDRFLITGTDREGVIERIYETEKDGDTYINIVCADSASGTAFDEEGDFGLIRKAEEIYCGAGERLLHFSSFIFGGNRDVYGYDGEKNSLSVTATVDYPERIKGDFAEGDAVTVSMLGYGQAGIENFDISGNNRSYIIRSVERNIIRTGIGGQVRYDFIFEDFAFETEGHSYTDGGIRYGGGFIKREIPALEYTSVYKNRLVGCKGDELFLSAAGNPLSFGRYDISSAAYRTSTGTEGDFTGCGVISGSLYFFKEKESFRLSGETTDTFSLTGFRLNGPIGKTGITPDFAVYLGKDGFYKSSGGRSERLPDKNGIYRDGTVSEENSDSAGVFKRYYSAVKKTTAACGRNFYYFIHDCDGPALCRMDTTTDNRYLEERGAVPICAGSGYIVYEKEDDTFLYVLPEAYTPELNEGPLTISEREESDYYKAVFSDFGFGFRNPYITEEVTLTLFGSGRCDIYFSFDGGEPEFTYSLIPTEDIRNYKIPCIPRRAERMRIILEGSGELTLSAIAINVLHEEAK